jgi:hypothetical protein
MAVIDRSGRVVNMGAIRFAVDSLLEEAGFEPVWGFRPSTPLSTGMMAA